MKKAAFDCGLNQFEKHLLENLRSCGVDVEQYAASGECLGAAVSGGADSVSLLAALAKIMGRLHGRLAVVTVNHNLRAAEESAGDVRFVEELCAELQGCGASIAVCVKTLAAGSVHSAAKSRGRGVEEAARALRYQAFDEFSAEYRLRALCLAHNQDDQLETVLMRFLQGSGSSGMAGIRMRRGLFVRPLLDVPRRAIEAYLRDGGFSWRTDSTNCDGRYLRNRIRGSLVPVLDAQFSGWRTAVLSGAEKFRADDAALSEFAGKIKWRREADGGVFLPREQLSGASSAVFARALYRAFSLVGADCRIPSGFVSRLESAFSSGADACSDRACGIRVSMRPDAISVKKEKMVATDSCFFAIIEDGGVYSFPFGTVFVAVSGGRAEIRMVADGAEFVLPAAPVPFCIRSRQQGDCIETADGGRKSVSDIFSDWHVAAAIRNAIPLVQELATPAQKLIGIAGSVCGFGNWIVRSDV
ncbi:MAG: tRNA lysidine(34) synthetase TilS [Treponemataceae bacterium]|nr:tRNA lysidine(34) synthetase TilS [Treponemataceae bacterium]